MSRRSALAAPVVEKMLKRAVTVLSLGAARRHAARSLDARAPTATLDAAVAKRFATDACYAVADRALQIFGGCCSHFFS